MLYHFLYTLTDQYPLFNLLRYITFRAACAALTALLISFVFGPKFISWLKRLQKDGQPIRDNGPASHLVTKRGTPTMGGAMILGSITLSVLLWGNLSNVYIWCLLLITLGFGCLGMVDDYIKLTKRHHAGMRSSHKFLLQCLLSGIACYLIMQHSALPFKTGITLPFFKDLIINLGYFYIPFVFTVIVGTSNAVNLTDGLDGLAIGSVIITAICFSLISYLVGHQVFAQYLQIHFVPGTGEIMVYCAAMVGAGLGFLWFNAPPAQVFMGDTGSLALGGALGTIAVITKHELVLMIIGGLFVIETLSVILQVGFFKVTKGRRIFLMAPIHHHFEKKGWSEPTIVIRFWIISIVLAIIGMATLKLR